MPAGLIVAIERVAQHRSRLFAIRQERWQRQAHRPVLAAEQAHLEFADVERIEVGGGEKFQGQRVDDTVPEFCLQAIDRLPWLLPRR